ncbi:transcription factor [Seiridium cupressi]
MAGKMNGKTNGYTNGYANGHTNGSVNGNNKVNGINGVNGSINGHSVTPRRPTPPAKANSSFLGRIFSIAARLSIWYSILTVLFRCPATLEACNETTPKICKPYFQAKQAVTPHLTPYYDAYAAPYVDLAKPYYDTVDRVVITPSRTYAVKYGGPQLEKARVLSATQWEKNVQPQLVKYQGLAKTQYDQTVAPHVNKASAAVTPYYDIAKTNALQTYHDVVLPSYLFVQPYALKGYDHASAFTTKTAVPSTLWAWNKTYVFLDSTVWPHLRDVYTVKVEPQLLRIVDRLGRYKELKPKGGAVEEFETAATQAAKSTFTKPSASIASTTAPAETTVDAEPTASSVAPAEPESETSTATPTAETNVESTPATLSKQEIREKAAKEVAEDLELWQGKFTKAADEGAAEIEERIEALASEIIEEEAYGKGLPLVSQLNTTASTEIAGLKKAILSTLEQHKESGNADQFEEEVVAAVRSAGLKIKDKAQGVRTWRENYEHKLEIAVTQAAQDHVRILESIRDLALQKIGMKWAWMDGVTYKHWQQFHKLRETFDEWTEDLKRLVITHPGLKEAQNAGVNVESQAMAVAGEAAQELGSLKQVALWKAVAGDYTDDFDASSMKLAAEAVQKKAAEAAQALKDAANTVQEGVHSLANNAEENVQSASESLSEGVSSAISGGTSTSTVQADETLTATVSLAEADAQDSETSAVPPLESLSEEPTHSATDLVSESTGPETPIAENEATSIADPEPLPTSDPVDGPEQMEETIVASPDEPTPPVQSSTTTVKSAMFGAAAQSVPSRQPILDTDDVGSSLSSVFSNIQSDVPHTITSAAQSAYTAAIAEAANQYSRAMSAVSVQISGEPKPAHEEMFSSASSAYFGALGAANSRLTDALTAASQGVYGTPTTNWAPQLPTVPSVDWERVQSIAQQNLQDSVNWAGEQYESAKVAIGLAEPTPSTAAERGAKLLDQAKHNYYAGLGVAHARYTEFLSAASTAVSSLTATPTPTDVQGSASSLASAATDSAGSVVSVAGESASSAASVVSDAAASVASSVTDAASNAGDSIAENWDYLLSQVSSQIYAAPTPTPWYENLYAAAGDYASQAGDYAASATDAAADYASHAGEYAASATDAAADYAASVGGFAAENASSATSIASEYADSASSAAASQYSVVASIVSELIVGKEPTFSESVASRLAEIYGSVTATAASVAGEVTDSAASIANAAADTVSTATEGIKDKVEHLRDEL